MDVSGVPDQYGLYQYTTHMTIFEGRQ